MSFQKNANLAQDRKQISSSKRMEVRKEQKGRMARVMMELCELMAIFFILIEIMVSQEEKYI